MSVLAALPLVFAMAAPGTLVARPHFSLTLPGRWLEQQSDEGVAYATLDGQTQVIITVLEARSSLSATDLNVAVDRLLELRRSSIQQMAGGKAEFNNIAEPVGPGLTRRATMGVDPSHSVRFFVSIQGTPSKVVTVTFYRYSLRGSASEFQQWAQRIIGSLTLGGA